MKKKVYLLTLVFIIAITNLFSTVASAAEATTKRQAILVIPGIMGSNLVDSDGDTVWVTDDWIAGSKQLYYLLNGTIACTSSGFSSETIAPKLGTNEYGTRDTYKDLVNRLKSTFQNSYDVIFASYDWRLDNTRSAIQLKKTIDNYDEVIIVAHSMGGLVTSKYLQMYGGSKVAKVITLGTPYWGAVGAAEIMYTGEVNQLPSIVRSAMSGTMRDLVRNYSSMYQLLPNTYYTNKSNWLTTEKRVYEKWYDNIWPRTKDVVNNTSATQQFYKDNFNSSLVTDAVNFHNSLYSSTAPIKTVDNTVIVGNGVSTVTSVKLATNSILGIKSRLSVPKYTTSGDGTVPLLSATIGNGTSYIQRNGIDHTGLVTDPTTLTMVVDSINGAIASKTATVRSAVGAENSSAIDYRITYAGDFNFEAIKDNAVVSSVNKLPLENQNYYDIKDTKKLKIDNIGTVGEDNAYLASFNEFGYTFKLKSNKEQKVDFAVGPNNLIYGFDNMNLNQGAEVYVNVTSQDSISASIDNNADGVIDSVVKPVIRDLSEDITASDLVIYSSDKNTYNTIDNTLYPQMKVKNISNKSIKLSDLELRYFFNNDGNANSKFECDWAGLNNATINASVKSDFVSNENGDTMLTLGFVNDGKVLAPGQEIEVQGRIHNDTWSMYNKSNDYSFNGQVYTVNNKVALYAKDLLIFGVTP